MSTPSTERVNISLSIATVHALTKGGYFLYTMFAVKMTNSAACPTIWSCTQRIMKNMTVEWPLAVSAYTSSNKITCGDPVRIGYATQISDGQTFEVTAGGGGQVKTEGPASEITISNTTTTRFTSGFSRPIDGNSVPLFAVPLYGLQSNVASTLPKILLQFTTKRFEPGTVIKNFVPKTFAETGAAYSTSLLVTADDSEARQVTYDINNGWDWGTYSWAEKIPANANLADLLIEPE